MYTVTMDVTKFDTALDALSARQLPFAASLTLNRSAEEVQTRLRQEEYLKLTIRNPQFMERLVKIKGEDRATKSRLVARVRIEGPEGSERLGGLLARHIEGGVVTKPGGGYSIDPTFQVEGMQQIPTEVLRFPKSAIIPRRLYPTNLRIVSRKDVVGTLPAKVHKTATGKYQLKGKQRTFVLNVPGTNTPLGIFQRGTGAGGKTNRTDINLIWYFKKSITLKPRYPFYTLSDRVFTERFPVNWQGFWSYALATAK